eukprot:11686-Heterococcus_DN1.PRE.2
MSSAAMRARQPSAVAGASQAPPRAHSSQQQQSSAQQPPCPQGSRRSGPPSKNAISRKPSKPMMHRPASAAE